MARRFAMRGSAPSARGRTRPARRPWLSPEVKAELRGIVFALLGLTVLLSLLVLPRHDNLVGSLGDRIAAGLTLLVGRPVAFTLPALLLWWALLSFKGRRPQHSWVKCGGAVLLMLSACALIGLATRHLPKDQSLEWAGVLGVFLAYDAPLALNLPRYLGVAGASLVFVAAAMAGLLIATGLLYTSLAGRVAAWLRAIPPRLLAGLRIAMAALAELTLWRREEGPGEELDPELRRPRSRAKLPAPKPSTRILNPHAHLAADERLGHSPAPALPVEPPPPPKPAPVIVDHEEATRATLGIGAKPPERLASARPNGPGVKQAELNLARPYELPPLDLLDPPRRAEHKMSHEEILEITARLEQTLRDFGIEATVAQVTQGPVITRFEIRPAPGVKVARITSLHHDIAMALRAKSVRILAPIPGKAAVGIEVPNPKPNFVFFRELAQSEAFKSHPSPLAFILGKTLSGEPHVLDLAAMPHLLIAGATGSGKSVCLNAIIGSILLRQPPDKVKMMLIDPKRVEFKLYDAIPHLISPVVTDSRKAPNALAWMVEHMEERYQQLAEVGVRNIDAYNAVVLDDKPNRKAMGRELKYMPHIVVVIDELADLMMVAKADVEENVQRIAQMARAVGIHLVLATQRPSVKVITGVIKANLPARIAFQVSQRVDSRVIIDQMGAEALLGNGDLLFSTGGAQGPARIQGAFISDGEVERLANFILAQEKAVYLKTDFQPKRSKGKADGDEPIGGGLDDGDEGETLSLGDLSFGGGGGDDEPLDEDLFRQAARLILQNRKASVSLIQRRMKIGFARAGRLMDMMEQAGIVGPYRGSKPREILVDPQEYLARLDRHGAAV